uniref:HECT-type E3 ubiquitin transferase n=1 Tax=Peronospora matthiolae TaxID=2874970 RepID=A0AAV1VEQ2_9STRA
MEHSVAPSRGSRKRRSGSKRKRSACHQREEHEELKTEEKHGEDEKQEEEASEEKKEEEEKSGKAVPTQWSCPSCTFLNEASRCFCEMCATPNPSPPATFAGAFRGTVTASEWRCAACTVVSPAAMRVCAVCGLLNPQLALSSGLSIAEPSTTHGDESIVSSCSDDSDEDDSNEDDEDDEEEDRETWRCTSCGTLSCGRTCLNCFAQRSKVARTNDNAKEKKSNNAKKQTLSVKKQKHQKREKKLQQRAKTAYGISISELKKMMVEPTSSRLVESLQRLTHTLAMIDASTENKWADGPSFQFRSFGCVSPSKTDKDPELLTVLSDIFSGREQKYPANVGLLALQSINYMMKMDRHMFARSKMVDVVRLYITNLLAWRNASGGDALDPDVAKNESMIVEECLSGLSSLCSTERFALREVVAQENFAGYLTFLTNIADGDKGRGGGFHASTVMTALEILQKCCFKLQWSKKLSQADPSTDNANSEKPTTLRQGARLTLGLATKLIGFLRKLLQHKHVPLHVKAARCLLRIFHRIPYDRPDIIRQLVSSEVLRNFVAVVVNTDSDESEESRLAMVSLLLYLFENRPQIVDMFLRGRIYTELFSGILPLLQLSSTAVRTNVLKLTSILARAICRKHSLESANSLHRNCVDQCAAEDKISSTCKDSVVHSPWTGRNRQQLNLLPDLDVLSTLLLDFIRADSIPAVNVLLKDGADLDFPHSSDTQQYGFDKPLNVAVECASLGMVRLLLKRGADIHQVGIGGTALHVAARTGRCDVAAFLLQCGARVHAKDCENNTVLDVVNLADKTTIEDGTVKSVPSPMKKLLDFYGCTSSVQDYDSDLSENHEVAGGKSRMWFCASDQDDEYMDDDEDDEMDDDEFEGEEGYYLDYDDDDDDDDEGSDDASWHSQEMGDRSDGDMTNDEDGLLSAVPPSGSRGRLDSVSSASSTETRGVLLDAVGNTSSQNVASRESDKGRTDESTVLKRDAFCATADEVYEFSLALTQCLLAVLRDMNIQNLERSVVSTIACVLEMAPSQLIRALEEADVVLILDTVRFLLQGKKLHPAGADAPACSVNRAASASPLTVTRGRVTTAAHDLPSFILAFRILETMVRKSSKESCIFHEIERRGICEQIELLNEASTCWASSTHGGGCLRSPCNTIFGRALDLLKSLRSDMLESGMLHLHKLRNLARRLKKVSNDDSLCENELVLVDLVDLFEQSDSITAYEFKHSELLPAIVQYISPQGALDENRALAIMQAFERCPSMLKHLIVQLQSIITQEETFPLISYHTGKGRELFPLTKQLNIAFVRPGDKAVGGKQHGSAKENLVHCSPLTHFQSFERSLFRCTPVIDSDLSLLYLNLVGHCIQKVVDGKWRKFVVVGYDDTRSYHLVKPVGGSSDDLAEMVLHDSQCKLLGSVKVYENIALDLRLYGLPCATNIGQAIAGKKKRKNNKRKRKSPTHKHQNESNRTCLVEVKNEGVLTNMKLPGAWYAAILVNDPDGVCKFEDQTCEDMLAAQSTHSVRLLGENRVLHNVRADCLRPRTLQPQVGSVVEVDGAVGEVTRIYADNDSSSGNASVLRDVKISSGIEKSRVKTGRVRFPARPMTTVRSADESVQTEATSMGRLFPLRNGLSLTGIVGDRVWVLPSLDSASTDLCVAGTIKGFPTRSESVCESATVLVEISFGSNPSLIVSVNQDRIRNFGVDGSTLSSSGSSRILAALQIASGRGSSSDNVSAIQRAFERAAGSLQQNRFGGGQGPSDIAMDQLRTLVSRNPAFSRNALSDVDSIDHASTSTYSAQSNNGSNEPMENEVQGEEGVIPAPPSVSTKTSDEVNFVTENFSRGGSLSSLQSYVSPKGTKPKMICSHLPNVSLVVGFRKCDASVAVHDQNAVSSECGFEYPDRSTWRRDIPASSALIHLNPSTQRFEATPVAREAILHAFNSFSGSGASHKKKRKKLSPVAQQTARYGVPWDIEKFIAFMLAVRGPTTYGRTGPIAKYCMLFSKFADPDANRRLLKAEGFVALVVHECKDAAKSKQMLKFLRSRGYMEKRQAVTSGGDDETEEKGAPSDNTETALVKEYRTETRQPIVLRGFPADQNVLKCVEDLRREYRAQSWSNAPCTDANPTATVDASLPPWKLTYKLYCDYQIQWEGQSSSETSASSTVSSSTESLAPLSAIASKLPARLLSYGIATLDSDDATEDLRWLHCITTLEAGSGGNGISVPDTLASAMRLLRYLFQFRADTTLRDEALWTSPRLYNKLETQMQDVLSMCSGIYPSWCDALVTHCKFFFPRDLREKLFRSTSFGCTRSLHWFRNRLSSEEGSADSGMSSMVGGGILNQEISISPVPKERVKVYRDNILQSAEAVMKMHAKRKAVLDVVFVGEKGYGSGVTAAFYSTVAHALQVVPETKTDRLWIPGEDDEADMLPGVDISGIAVDTPVIRHSNGLFPYPHRRSSPKLVERFCTMGRLAGKALMDDHLLPLPLSPQFLKLVVGESFGLEDLGDIFLSHGRIVHSMYKASRKLGTGEQNVQIDNLDIQSWLSAVGFTFIDPFSQEPLVAGGEDIDVTPSNLILYVRAVLELWLDSGIRSQVLAFREGISEVLPLEKLRLLFVPELLSMLCGEKDIEWNVDSLMKDTKLAHGYTKDSQPVQFFFEVLEQMPATERRTFLLYATGCPNLPPGGFPALKPPFEVVRRVVDIANVDLALPFARTCTNTLHLPAYSSRAVLAKQMAFAIANSRGVIDRD